MRRLCAVVTLAVACAAPDAAPDLAADSLATGGLRRDVRLVCDPAPHPSDAPDAMPDCDAVLVDAAGGTRALGRGGLLAAERFDPDRLLLLTRDLRLVLRDGDGRERTLATAAADPRVADEGGRVAYVELPAGTTELRPGVTGRLVLLDLRRGTRRVVADHPMDSTPFPVPGSDDVLFVSARTGVASLWLAAPGRPPEQLTNVGARAVGPGFVPVPERELAWVPGTRTAVYPAGGRTVTVEVPVR
jgi:hypothetical protein